MTEEYRGVLDRFEDNLSIILLEHDGSTLDDIALPDSGHHQDAILAIVMEEMVQIIPYRPEEPYE